MDHNTVHIAAGFGSWLAAAAAGDEVAARRSAAYLNRPEFELYDLQADPSELNNLAGDQALAEQQAALFDALQTWMREQGDSGIETERSALQHMDQRIVQRIRELFGE